MDKTPFFQNTFLKWEKILDKLPHRSYFKNDKDGKNQNDLNGGKVEAGPSEKNENEVKEDDKQSESKDKQSETELNVGHSGVEIDQAEAKADAAQFNKYQEVDDLINGAIENIQEASAALANLAGSHEHELKIIIMNILVKFHDWIDNIQKKLNLTKKALNDLKWILATKDIELKVKNREVNELRQSITEYQQKLKTHHEEVSNHPEEALNSLGVVLSNPVPMKPDKFKGCSDHLIASPSQNVPTAAVTRVTTISLSSSLKISSDHTSQSEYVTAKHSLVLSVAKATNAFPLGPKPSEHEVEVKDIAIDLPVTTHTGNGAIDDVNPENKDLLVAQPRKSRSSHQKIPVALANMSASRTIVSNASSGSFDRQMVLLDMSSMEVGHRDTKLPRTSQESVDAIKEATSRPLSRIPEQQSSWTRTDSKEDNNNNQGIKSPEVVRTLDQSENLPDISALRMSILRASVNNGNQTSKQSIRNSDTSVFYEQCLSSQTNLQVPIKEKPVIINITQQRSNNFDSLGQSVTYNRERNEDERNKREAELKEKLSEIRRENDKLKKDKLKYESTMKKVLFHGFMSLIKEEKASGPKKRITKICYTPCAPCSNVASSTSNKPSVPDLRITESLTSQEPKRTQSKKCVNAHPCLSKQSSRNIFCFSKQRDINSCAKIPELYVEAAESIGTEVKTICHGGKCSRAAYYNRNLVKNIDRGQCCAKTSKFQTHMHKNSATGFNISPAGLQEYTRVMGCKNVLTTWQRPIN